LSILPFKRPTRIVHEQEGREDSVPSNYARVTRVCQTCGRENPPRYRFCGSCGKFIQEPISPIDVAAAYLREHPEGAPRS
jgi:hypothetical protein